MGEGIKMPPRRGAQNLPRMACHDLEVAFLTGLPVKSAFALLSAKVTKPKRGEPAFAPDTALISCHYE